MSTISVTTPVTWNRDNAVGQVDGLVDVVGDEDDRDADSWRIRRIRSSSSARVCASTDANGSSMSSSSGR